MLVNDDLSAAGRHRASADSHDRQRPPWKQARPVERLIDRRILEKARFRCRREPRPGLAKAVDGLPATGWKSATSAQIPTQPLIAMAHTTRSERVASAFGGITGSSVEIATERAMIRYHTVSKKEFETHPTRGYPSSRYDFRPAAYVVLTRDGATGAENLHG